ncbi:MAG: ribonuclease Z [Bacteroidota bacterium]
MTIEKQDNLVIVSQGDVQLSVLLEELKGNYADIQGVNAIVALTSPKDEIVEGLATIVSASEEHKSSKKSFIVVSENLEYDEVPEGLSIAPTVQEAKDIIEMEEIERDLGL